MICEQDYPFRLELSTKSDTRAHTSCDNNNNKFCRRWNDMLLRYCLCSWFSFFALLSFHVFVAFVAFVKESCSVSQASSRYFLIRSDASRVLECLPKDLDISLCLGISSNQPVKSRSL